MKNNAPNLLSLSRMVATVLVFTLALVNQPWSFLAATVLFFIASVTDFFDGYLARRLHVVSPLGRVSAATHHGSSPAAVSATKTAALKAMSVKGSSTTPTCVSQRSARARIPSRMSVNALAPNSHTTTDQR